MTNESLADALSIAQRDTARYAQMAATIRDLNPKKMTTAEVQAVFSAIAMFFERAGEEQQKSAESIERVLTTISRD